jgi:hypothetical protein
MLPPTAWWRPEPPPGPTHEAQNSIESNLFYRNTEGGTFPYKNCSEKADISDSQFYRRQPAMSNHVHGKVEWMSNAPAMAGWSTPGSAVAAAAVHT